MIDFLMLIVIAACLLCIVFSGVHHRKRAIQSGQSSGSLWHHIKQCFLDDKSRKLSWFKKRIDGTPIANYSEPIKAVVVNPTVGAQRRTAKKVKSALQGDAGIVDEIQFAYPDSQGTGYVTRHVSVRAVNADYMEGYCHTKRATRTFYLQHIRGKVISLRTGEIQRFETWANAMRRLSTNGKFIRDTAGLAFSVNENPTKDSVCRQWQTAAYFVGFRDARRSELESMAESACWQVRSGFSSSLDVLIVGPLVGKAQLTNASVMKIEIISESEFRDRVAVL